MQLIGKLYRSKGGWTADWIFVDDGRVLSTWSDSKSDARRAMASGPDGAAAPLTRRSPQPRPPRPPGHYPPPFPRTHRPAHPAPPSAPLPPPPTPAPPPQPAPPPPPPR